MSKYLKIPIALLAVTWLTGCVGFHTWTTKDIITNEPIAKDKLLNKVGSPDDQSNDGSVLTYSKRNNAWCGMALYVIVPIPLALPACSEEDKYQVENGIILSKTSTRVRKSGVICGPFYLFMNGVMSFGQPSRGWCD